MRYTPSPHASLIPGLLPELSYCLMDYLDGEDLACIGKTSRIGQQYAASTIFRRVFALFRWELRSYDNFVEILEQTGSVIGGLAALCILFPEFGGPASHVHIYAPRATHGNVVDYLVSEEGFGSEVVDPDPEKTGLLKHMDGVLSVVRVTKGDVMLDIVQSRNSSPLFPITSEWCSGLFNYIASRSYMSAYAPLNRDSRILLSPSRLLPGNAAPEGVRRSMLFWRRSGWEIALHWRQWCGGAQNCDGVNSLGCAAANRYFGDRFCVWGSTRAIGEPTESGGRDPSETVTVAWWRGGRTCRDACSRGRRDITPGARLMVRNVTKCGGRHS